MTRPDLTCPECGAPAKFEHNSKHIYHGRDYGPGYGCRPCGTWTGCHRGTRAPLGKPGTKATRQARMRAHAAFDPLWKSRWIASRSEAYKWLSEQLGITHEECHIAWFDQETCDRVVEICGAAR